MSSWSSRSILEWWVATVSPRLQSRFQSRFVGFDTDFETDSETDSATHQKPWAPKLAAAFDGSAVGDTGEEERHGYGIEPHKWSNQA